MRYLTQLNRFAIHVIKNATRAKSIELIIFFIV